MGIRETLNKNPAITTGATIAIIVIALIVIFVQFHTSRPHAYNGTKAFFTDDDGEHWFEADQTNVAPFTDKNGLTAVRCYVFKCGKTKFVGYLEKYTDEAKKQMEENAGQPTIPGPNPLMMGRGRLLKKKGDANWVPMEPQDHSANNKIEEIIKSDAPMDRPTSNRFFPDA